MNKESKKLLLQCCCGCSVLSLVEYDEEEVYISVYHQHPNVTGIKQKLAWIWSILKGKVYDDEIVISRTDVARLKEFVKDL